MDFFNATLASIAGGIVVAVIVGWWGTVVVKRRNRARSAEDTAKKLVRDLLPAEIQERFTFDAGLAMTDNDEAGLALISAIIKEKAQSRIQVIGRGPQWDEAGTRVYVSAVAKAILRKVRYERVLVIDSKLPRNALVWLLLLERFMAKPDYRGYVTLHPLPREEIVNPTRQFQLVDGTWLHDTSRFYDSSGDFASSAAESFFAVAPHPLAKKYSGSFSQHQIDAGKPVGHGQVVDLLDSMLRSPDSDGYSMVYHWDLVLKVLDFLASLDAEGMPEKGLHFIGSLTPFTFTYQAAALFSRSARQDQSMIPVATLPFKRLKDAINAFIEGKVDYLCVPAESSELGPIIPPTVDGEMLALLEKEYNVAKRLKIGVDFVLASKSTSIKYVSKLVAVKPAFGHVSEVLAGRAAGLPRDSQDIESNYHAAWVAGQDQSIAAVTTRDAAEIVGLNVLTELLGAERGAETEFAIYSRVNEH